VGCTGNNVGGWCGVEQNIAQPTSKFVDLCKYLSLRVKHVVIYLLHYYPAKILWSNSPCVLLYHFW